MNLSKELLNVNMMLVNNTEKIRKLIRSKRFFMLDGDGTLYLWDKSLKSSGDFIKKIKNLGKQFVILSNNDSESKKKRLDFLRRILKVDLSDDNLLLPNDLVIDTFRRRRIRTFDGLISDEFVRELIKNGFKRDTKNPDIILIGFDTDITYDKIKRIVEHINSGKKFILTHIDPLCPYKDGMEIPDAGLIAELIETATKKEPEETLGKPFRSVVHYILDKAGASKQESLIIGDRINTDIKMANENGVDSIWIRGSVDKPIKSRYKPTLSVESVDEIYKAIKVIAK